MQKKVLLSSILVIALCLSAIAGSTYALFTDKAETSIAITSGDVEVTANMTVTQTYSAVASQNQPTSPYLVDEYGQYYEYQDQANYVFSNGGYVEAVDGTLVVHKITPGDKFDAKIIIDNVGDVDMVYRYKITSADALANAMVVTTNDGNVRPALKDYTSDWATVVVAPGETVEVNLSFELPVYTGNNYQSEANAPVSLTYDIVVEAVQGNANTNGIVDVQY